MSYSSDVIIIQDNAVHEADFSYSIDVATEITRRYLLTKKDVRLGRLSYNNDEFYLPPAKRGVFSPYTAD